MSGVDPYQDRNLNGPESGKDALFLLTEAIMSYLEEVHACRTVCQRHESTTAVCDMQKMLRFAKFLPWTAAAAASIAAAVKCLPGWEMSPFWTTEKADWLDMKRAVEQHQTGDRVDRLIVSRGVSWQGRPILVCVSSAQSRRFIAVELALPHRGGDLPELPLRAAAHTLLCYEYVRRGVAPRDLLHSAADVPGFLTLYKYLMRAVPQNLYASY